MRKSTRAIVASTGFFTIAFSMAIAVVATTGTSAVAEMNPLASFHQPQATNQASVGQLQWINDIGPHVYVPHVDTSVRQSR